MSPYPPSLLLSTWYERKNALCPGKRVPRNGFYPCGSLGPDLVEIHTEIRCVISWEQTRSVAAG